AERSATDSASSAATTTATAPPAPGAPAPGAPAPPSQPPPPIEAEEKKEEDDLEAVRDRLKAEESEQERRSPPHDPDRAPPKPPQRRVKGAVRCDPSDPLCDLDRGGGPSSPT